MADAGPQLCLGTVQLGLAYGIAGSGERVDEGEARAILAAAWDAGIRRLDTAPGYGDIEERLAALVDARPFSIVTKIPAIPAELDADSVSRFVVESLDRSMVRLGETIAGILFHSADDLLGDNGERVWDTAETWCSTRGIPLGLSVYDPATLEAWASAHPVAMAQLPANAFDQRLSGSPVAAMPIELTVRSAFLQGLLLMDEAEAARRLPAASTRLARWHATCRERSVPLATAALGFVKAMRGVDFCAVGVESVNQLVEVAEAWEAAHPIEMPEMASNDPELVDPRRWKSAA